MGRKSPACSRGAATPDTGKSRRLLQANPAPDNASFGAVYDQAQQADVVDHGRPGTYVLYAAACHGVGRKEGAITPSLGARIWADLGANRRSGAAQWRGLPDGRPRSCAGAGAQAEGRSRTGGRACRPWTRRALQGPPGRGLARLPPLARKFFKPARFPAEAGSDCEEGHAAGRLPSCSTAARTPGARGSQGATFWARAPSRIPCS